MKILEINKFYYRRRGAESHFLDLVELLREKGNEVAVFSMKHKENRASSWDKYFVRYVGYNHYDATVWERLLGICRMFWSFGARRNLRKLLQEFHPDVAHIHNIYHQLSPSILGILKEEGIPIVMTVHDHAIISPDKDVYYPEIGRRYWKFLFIRKYSLIKRVLLVLKMYVELWWRPYTMVDHFIVPSEFVRQNFLSWGVPTKKITVLRHFLSMRKPSRNENNFQLKNIPDQFALSLGSVSREKGSDRLIEVFTRLQFPLVLAGSVDESIRQENNKYIYYLGQQRKEDVIHLLKKCNFVVSGSQLSETFGLVIIEANWYGKPFVGFSVGAFSEIVTNKENGHLVTSWGEMEEVIRKSILGQMIFDGSRIQENTRKKYDKEKYTQEIQTLFQRTVKR